MDDLQVLSNMSEYSIEERQKEKQASRDEDQRRLAAGEVTRDQLRIENSI